MQIGSRVHFTYDKSINFNLHTKSRCCFQDENRRIKHNKTGEKMLVLAILIIMSSQVTGALFVILLVFCNIYFMICCFLQVTRTGIDNNCCRSIDIIFWPEHQIASLRFGFSITWNRALSFQKNCFIYFNENPLKMMKNTFYFILNAQFNLKICKSLCWLFGIAEKSPD